MLKWQKRVKVDYRDGDTRIVRRFLLWPVCIQDEWRWLGLVLIKQRYCEVLIKPRHYGYIRWSCRHWWENREWIDGR